MNISELSIRKPVFAWMLMFGLIFFGWISFRNMGVSQMPDVDFPVISVQIGYEGAAPEVMESDVLDAVEDAVMSVQGVRSISAYARYGSATVTIEFDLSRNIDVALQEIQTKIAQAQKFLPKQIDPPVITKTNPDDQPILWLTASREDGNLLELMRYVRDHIKDKFTTVPGVGEVFLGGYIDPNLRIWLSSDKLNKYELTPGDILDTLSSEHNELPAGQIETDRIEYNVRTLGEALNVDDFGKIVVNNRGGRPNYNPIAINQIAKIEEGLADIRRISRFNGKPSVGLGIRKQRGSNAVEVAKQVKKRLAELQTTLPKEYSMGLNFDTTKFIEESVGELNFTLILSALFTAVVCWMFLGSWSSTVNILMAIPTSIIGAFIILSALGFTLNTFTLLGLSLAIGIVVDDAIMVLENIVRYKEMGKTKIEAALIGAKEISFAAMAATISIIAIFLPVAFMRGVIGKFFFQFGVTMTVAVAISLLEALTLTPMRCSQFVESTNRSSRFGRFVESTFHNLASTYHRTLRWALKHRVMVVISSLIFFFLSMFSATKVNKEFSPAQDQSAFLMRLQTPTDSSMAFTNKKFLTVEEFITKQPEVLRYYAAVGGFGGGEVNSGMIFVTMKPKGQRGIRADRKKEFTQIEFMDYLRKEVFKLKELKVFMQDLSMRGFTASRGFPVEFSIRGPDWDVLAKNSQILMDKLKATDLVTDIDSDYQLGKPEIRIIPDRVKAAQRGVSINAISETVNVLIGGKVQGKFSSHGRRNDIRVRLDSEERDRADQIKKLYVRNNRGELVRLADVVSLEEKPSLSQISRLDRERAINVFANIKQGKSQAAALEAVQKLSKDALPENYHVVMSGSAQSFKESFSDLKFALILGLIVAYMVLASQFNSFLDPVTVLMALPFSLSGAFMALWLTGNSLNIFSFIGLILLMGIVKKNSILLVEFTNHTLQEKKLPVDESLLIACPIRLRPILMTSFATIAGAIPPALAFGPGAETRVPMAVAVIGGVFVSTILTLIVVPCVYSLFAQIKSKKFNKHKNNSANAEAIA